MYEYRCQILRWLDGDTAEVLIDVGFRISARMMVRVAGINAPEIHAKDQATRDKAQKSKARAVELCPILSQQELHTAKARLDDKYGRWLAAIVLADGRNFSDVMIGEGLAVAYDP